jgi:hypothetical protein
MLNEQSSKTTGLLYGERHIHWQCRRRPRQKLVLLRWVMLANLASRPMLVAWAEAARTLQCQLYVMFWRPFADSLRQNRPISVLE